MPRSSSSSFTARTGGIWVVALAAVWAPQQAFAQPIRTPQFTATAISFKALHETHANWMGSDEVFVTFHDFTGPGFRKSETFGDVDAGETRDVAGQCISPQPNCDRGASSLAFGISLQEYDYSFAGYCHGSLASTPEDYERDYDALTDWCPGDDLIGKAKVKLTREELLAALPTVGAHFDRTVPLTGGDGRYEFTYRVTRLPNALNIPPIGPPIPVTVNPISLQAMVNPIGQIQLTWSGASTANVDIYRGTTKLISTVNDGSYTTAPQSPGTYLMRVCEFNSTAACSADVQVVVG